MINKVATVNFRKYIIFNLVFNATFNIISAISWRSVCIGGGNRSTRRKPPTCRKYDYIYI